MSIAVNDIGNRLSHSFEHTGINPLHGVASGVPAVKESCVAIHAHVNDVDALDAGIIHLHMIVGDGTTGVVNEVVAKTTLLRHGPHFVNDLGSILERNDFLAELRSTSTHHVEQNTEAWRVALGVWMLCPVLGA